MCSLFHLNMNLVLETVKKIPRGKIITYKRVAEICGIHPRTVATALRKNFDESVPCWRVIHTDGRVGGFNRGVEEKIRRLKEEGIKVSKERVVDLKTFLSF